MTSRCKFCGEAIIWAKTAAGKDMPLDASSETRWLVEGGVNALPTTRPVQVHRTHFATCPNYERGAAT